MKFKSHLISGAGNTFHLTFVSEAELASLSPERMKAITKKTCTDHKADGFIFLSVAEGESVKKASEFKWNFYNNDGSDAEMCGNATRCVGYYIENQLHSDKKTWNLATIAGNINISGLGKNTYKVIMNPFKKFENALGFFCDTGVPHLVLDFASQSLTGELFNNLNEEFKMRSSKLRFHSAISPKGTNVTYVQLSQDPQKLKAVSFERGVEDFTAACGTGAAAAALYNLTMRGIRETQVEMPGGTLIMNLQDLTRPEMIGPAELLGSFENEISV